MSSGISQAEQFCMARVTSKYHLLLVTSEGRSIARAVGKNLYVFQASCNSCFRIWFVQSCLQSKAVVRLFARLPAVVPYKEQLESIPCTD